MSQEPRIRIARKGNEIGEFSPWEINQKWIAGEISMTDDYWRGGMAKWGKLQEIKDEILAAKKPEPTSPNETPAPSPVIPPLPPSPARPSDDSSPYFAFGVIVFIIGAITLLGGLASDATGSAIRQGVFAQHMTNGILLMILGVMLAKR
jgi:hypothetical protein